MIFAKSIYSKSQFKYLIMGKCLEVLPILMMLFIIEKLIEKPALVDKKFDRNNPNPASSSCPHRIFNIGSNKSVDLEEFISKLEREIGINAIYEYRDMQAGDVKETKADCSILDNWIGEYPKTSLDEGIKNFVTWYKDFYNY